MLKNYASFRGLFIQRLEIVHDRVVVLFRVVDADARVRAVIEPDELFARRGAVRIEVFRLRKSKTDVAGIVEIGNQKNAENQDDNTANEADLAEDIANLG